ncbi:MAG: LuxR C-terminal-related transcriptional regulator [Burkholderiaceae bacterium]|jgi:FixJ family two-component response regulator|nr:LuxR C-terminal-related transcriptional regulator [Burkholderiaceae bacterium]
MHASVGDSAACILIGDFGPAEDLPTTLADHGSKAPIVMVSDRCDVNSVRSAFRRGVVDCLRGLFDQRELLRAVRRALARDRLNRVKREEEATALRRLARLSRRESQVMAMACEGYRNLEIALLIGVRPRTVEVHKARLMERLKVRTLAEFIRVREHGATMPSKGRTTGACDCAKEFAPNADVRPNQRYDRTA